MTDKTKAVGFIARVQEILNSSTPNLIWEVGTSVKIISGHLTGFGPDYVEMQIPRPGAHSMVTIRAEEITYISRGCTEP
jgi:transcription antitermination factor NusG